jgi:hypothetical protein
MPAIRVWLLTLSSRFAAQTFRRAAPSVRRLCRPRDVSESSGQGGKCCYGRRNASMPRFASSMAFCSSVLLPHLGLPR